MITATLTTETICSCLNCGRPNYAGGFGAKTVEETVAVIDIRIQRGGQGFITKLCQDCLAELTEAVHPFRSSLATLVRQPLDITEVAK